MNTSFSQFMYILLPSVDMMAHKRKTVIDAVILFMMILFISLSEINGKD